MAHTFSSRRNPLSNSSTTSKGTALITGASTGIGAVYADRLAKRGYDLILIARNGKLLNELAISLTASTGRKVEALPADLTNKDELRTVEQRLRTDRSITALVNNAGFGGVSTLLDSSVDDMENMIDLNITALLRLTAENWLRFPRCQMLATGTGSMQHELLWHRIFPISTRRSCMASANLQPASAMAMSIAPSDGHSLSRTI